MDQIMAWFQRPCGTVLPCSNWEKQRFVMSGYCMPRGIEVLVSIPSPTVVK